MIEFPVDRDKESLKRHDEKAGPLVYIYQDRATQKELFRFTAWDRMVADKMFTQETGKVPTNETDNVTLVFERPEKEKYVYRDNFAGGKIVFECEANSILEADEKYKEATGQDVSEQNNIGCQFEKISDTTQANNGDR